MRAVCGPALDAERDTGIPACVTVAQAILESAAKVNGVWTWGGSSLFRLYNNAFGIKHSHQTATEDYGEYKVPTTEIGANGQAHVEVAGFSKFAFLSNCFRAHSMLFLRLPRYLAAREAKSDWKKFAEQIMLCGYSTDRPEFCQRLECVHYAGKLIGLVRQYHLDSAAQLHYYAGQGSTSASPSGNPIVDEVELANRRLKADEKDLAASVFKSTPGGGVDD